MAPARPSPHSLALMLLLAVVLVWGTTFTLVKSALADVSPLLFNFLRMTLAFAVLAAFNFRSLRIVSRAELRYASVAGLFLGLGYQLQTAGLARTTASRSAFITGLVVVMVPLLSTIPGVRHAASPPTRWAGYAGAGIAFCGLVLLTTPAGAGSNLLAGMGVGELLTLGCALAFAAHLLSLSHAAIQVNARVLGTVQIGVAALLMLVTLPAGGQMRFHASPRILLALGVTSLLATAAAFTIQSWAQQHLSSTQTALIFTLEPVFAWLTSLVLLRERLDHRELVGAGLILTGILISELLSGPPALLDAPAGAASNAQRHLS